MTIQLVAFDADDTLWHSENEFAVTQERIRSLLEPYCEPDELDRRLLETERSNLELYGYGAKSFILSVVETALDLAGERLETADIQAILDAGKELLSHPVELCNGAADAVAWAAERWPVVVVTKGDLFHQESKVARSGLGEMLSGIDIVAEKDESTFARVWRRHGVGPDQVVMIGNSIKSDIAPVLALGGWGVLVPYHLLWEVERHDDEEAVRSSARFLELGSLTELPAALGSLVDH